MPTQTDRSYLPYFMVAAGASLWGIIGIFVFGLSQAGFSSLDIVALRVVSATIILFVLMYFLYPEELKIKLSHFYYFIGTGVVSIIFFNWCYFTAIQETGLTIAVILLYTGPAFVVIMAALFFRERVTTQKVLALIFTFIGAALVVEFLPITAEPISWYGILVGIGAGFGYALYSIFGKIALREYSPLTIIFYTFLTASIVMIPFSGTFFENKIELLIDPKVLLIITGMALFPTVLAYLLYTIGLSRIEAGRASITTMIEPVAATLLGVTMYGDSLQFYQVLGIALVLMAIVMIQIPGKTVRA